jgi:hypothetical protein
MISFVIMPFKPDQDHSINLAQASIITKAYRDANINPIIGGFFGKDAIQAILNQTDCVGLKFYFAIENGKSYKSVLCVAYIGAIPKTEDEVFSEWSSFNVACFYSVWSNERGYGRKIIQSSINHIRWNRPYITNAVTFSPKTDMAKNFHLANGAKLYRENEDSYNFEYTL